MGLIKGIDVVLYEKLEIGKDDFKRPIYGENKIIVNNVLVSPVTTDDLINELSLTGKKIDYIICIPKGDTHNWLDAKVEFFGKTFITYGFNMEYINENIPLSWNKKVYCELYG